MEKHGTGKLKKTTKPAPAIRLTASATYTRPTLGSGGPAIPLTTTYRDGFGAQDPADLQRRCLASRAAAQNVYMVKTASHHIPLDVADELEAAVSGEFAAQTQAALATQKVEATLRSERLAPTATAAEAQLAATMAALPRCPVQGKLARDFFTAGANSLEGPFPGSESREGKHMAATYWEHAKNAAGGKMLMTKPGRLAPNGQLLKNYANL